MQGRSTGEGDLAFYRENGYLMIEDAVSPEGLAELQAVARDFIDRSRRVAEATAPTSTTSTRAIRRPARA
ncbi:MAG: hypothetical protein R3D28_08040 [Geminicoccaceae bacterium]